MDLFYQTEMNPYNLRIQHNFEVPYVRTVYHGSESISYLGPKIWDVLPVSIKEANTFNSFKKLIKKIGSLKHFPVDCVRATHLALVLL